MIRFSASFRKLALGLTGALAAISLSSGSAQAIVVTVGGAQFDVTTFLGSNNNYVSDFETAANGGVMLWWGNATLALDFATALGSNFGSEIIAQNGGGPYLAYDTQGASTSFWLYNFDVATPGIVDGFIGNEQTRYYAQATLIPSPAPAPLPILGPAAAFGFSRKLRKRIKLAPAALGSSLTQA